MVPPRLRYRLVHEAAQDPLLTAFVRDYMEREATPSLALHLESYASYATKDHGLTFPAFVGGEVWF